MATTAPAPRTPNRPARLNRALLTLIGLVLILAGAYVLLRSLGVLARLALLPAQDPAATLLPADIDVAGWVPYVVIAGAVVVGLLCLRWLVAQTRRRTTGETWRLHADGDHGMTRLDTSTAASALAAEIETYTGMHSASAVISGPRAQPELHLWLAVEEQAPLGELRERIDTHALPRLRQALELDALPTETIVRLAAKPQSSRTR